MDREVIGEIFQITVLDKWIGDRPGFVYMVGKNLTINGRKFLCSRLVHDENAYYFHGVNRYTVYAKNTSTGEEFKYVDLENAALEIKRDIPKELL